MNGKADDVRDPRGDQRSNVFLGGILRSESTFCAVRIRNLSFKGALIDGPKLPAEGAAVHVQRGSLIAHGQIAWRRDTQAGIRFDEAISVADWVRPTGHAGQRRVDMVVAAVREDIATVTEYQASAEADDLDELQSFGSELHQICESLSELSSMSIELAEAIGRIESIAQALLKLRRLCTP